MNVEVRRRAWRLRTPLETAHGTVDERVVLELRLGEGRGEAAPLGSYDGVSLERCEAALEAYLPVLREADGRAGHEVLDDCREIADLPQALAAVDVALWDRAGLREGRPVASLLADDPLDAVPVNATVGAAHPVDAAAAAEAAAAAGYGCVKLKVGIGDDARRVAAVRAAMGPGTDLRLDANGAWDVETAIAAIERLAPAGLEIVEEPVHGIDALRAVRRAVPVRIAMDETLAVPGALASGATDAVCLKLSRSGGISGLLAQAALVRATGAEPYIASTLDGPVGIAAALHCAAALRVDAACGLATLPLFAETPDVLPVLAGRMAVPQGPGLGI